MTLLDHPSPLAATSAASPKSGPLPVDPSAESHTSLEIHGSAALGTSCTDGQIACATQAHAAVGAPLTPTTPPNLGPRPNSGAQGWLELRLWAEMFHDAQQSRIANKNRADRGGADPAIFDHHIEALQRTEHECKKALLKTYRRVAPPGVIEWQQRSGGIGDHMLARLLGHLGHPVHATPHHWEGAGSKRTLVADEPYERTIGQLWQYCGHGAPARRTKGMSADDLAAQGSKTLKILVWNIASRAVTIKPDDPRVASGAWPYRDVYDNARLDAADKVHRAPCVRCGPSGKPAPEGSPWSPGHQQAHAIRIVGKEILRDLWLAAS